MGHDLPFTNIGTPLSRHGKDTSAILKSTLTLQANSWRDFDSPAQVAAWDVLAQDPAEANPFYESWSLLPALGAFDPQGKVSLLTLEAGGELVGLMPVKREARYYRHPLPNFRNWTHANCFLGAPLVAKGFERLFWTSVFDWVDANARMELFLHLSHMPATGPLHIALVDVLRGETDRRPAETVMQEERAALVSRASSVVYFNESISTRKRKELRRQERRLEEQGELAFERLSGDADLDRWVEQFLELESRGWKGASGSSLASDKRTATMFHQALAGAAQRGRLERLALTLDGKPIAMLVNFLTSPGSFSFKTAFDEAYARFSPGVLLQRENLALLDRDDIDWCDSCAAQDHPMIDHFWRERRAIARHSIGIGGTIRRAIFSAIARGETRQTAKGIL